MTVILEMTVTKAMTPTVTRMQINGVEDCYHNLNMERNHSRPRQKSLAVDAAAIFASSSTRLGFKKVKRAVEYGCARK